MPRTAPAPRRTNDGKNVGRTRKPRRPSAAALLVIECDVRRLAADGLAVGQSFCDLVRSFHPRIKIELIQTSTLAELTRALGEVGQSQRRFRLAVLIGHSNERGIQWTSDRFLTWAEVGAWLNYFDPASIFLTACDAGRLAVARDLFAAMPQLKRVYGSPTKLAVVQSHPLVVCAMDELGRRGLTAEGRTIIQGLNLVLTRGLMFRWTRGEVTRGGPRTLRAVGTDLAARLYDKWMSQGT